MGALTQSQPPLLILTGPTASGKSAVAVAVARAIGGEIVSADSQQVYRGCDIGTGKLSLVERQGVLHHLLDVIAPDASFDLYRYIMLADAAIREIVARGRTPIVVGGTGLYLKGLVYGICDAPPRDAALRSQLEARLQAEGVEVLHAELARRDAEAATLIHPRHSSRIVRALEVMRLTGQSILSFQRAHRCVTPRYDAQWIGLQWPRPLLRERIAARVTRQLAEGWDDEVTRLRQGYGDECAIFRAIGYRELLAQQRGELSRDEAAARIVVATQQYAKRQETFARQFHSVQWLDMTAPDPVDGVLTLLSS